MSTILQATELTKTYRDVTAVDAVSFTLEAGKIYGLLGRNGAGKTTIMQMITAQLFPTSGDLRVFGEPPYENRRVLERICFIKESQKYPETFRVRDVLDVCATVFPNWDRAYAESLRSEFRLPPKRRIKKLSRGMLSSVSIIVGLASRAPLTIFDEPYLGLDAVARELFYQHLMDDYAEHPRTVVLSTHLIDEVSRMLEHVLLIDNGKLIINQSADELRGQASTVVGPTEAVERFTATRETVHREALGSLTSATLLGRMDTAAKKEAAALGLELAPVSLQQLMVHLTTNKTQAEAVSK